MESIKAEKLRAMNSYKKNQFLYGLILHSLIPLTCSLLCSYPYWFPSLYCTMKHFLFTSLPNISSFFVNPKCLFIVVNAIVVFLVGESKRVDSNSSPVSDLYDEYVERSHGLRGHATFQEREVERNCENHDGYINHSLREDSNLPEEKEERKLEMNLIEDSVNKIEGKEVKEEEEKEAQAKDDGEDEEEEETGLPVEELNKRADEFIARVNKKMWLEAKLMVCAKA